MFALSEFSWIDRLDQTAPGPELGGLLASIDRDRLDGYGLVALMKARARQIACLQAEFYADLWAVAEAEEPMPGEGS
ncbi:MAG: hypothetical protein ACRDWH_08530 [Acidimicrobiia bacterium]